MNPKRFRLADLSKEQRRAYLKVWNASKYILGKRNWGIETEAERREDNELIKAHAILWRALGEILRGAGIEPGQRAPLPRFSNRCKQLWDGARAA